MVWLLNKATAKARTEQNRATSNFSVGNLENISDITNVVETSCVGRNVTNSQDRIPFNMALNREDSENCKEENGSLHSKQERQQETCSHNPTPTSRLQSANCFSRQRILSVTRHRFEPFFSKDALRNGLPAQRISSTGNVANQKQGVGKPAQGPRYGNAANSSPQLRDTLCGSAVYRTCYKCCHCQNENDIVFQAMRPVMADNNRASTSCQSKGTAHLLGKESGKGADARGSQNAQEFCLPVTSSEVKLPQRSSGTPQANATGRCNLQKADDHSANIPGDKQPESCIGACGPSVQSTGYRQCCLIGTGQPTERRYLIVNKAAPTDDSRDHNNSLGPGDNTLKVFVADKSTNCQSSASQRMFMPPNEKNKCLKFSPGQYFDIVFEKISPEKLKKLVSEASGKTGTELGSVNSKENFVKELRSIFSRLPLLDEKRLEEKGLQDMILMARAYLDKYEREIRQNGNGVSASVTSDERNKESLTRESTDPFVAQVPSIKESEEPNATKYHDSHYQSICLEPVEGRVDEEGVPGGVIKQAVLGMGSCETIVLNETAHKLATAARRAGNEQHCSGDVNEAVSSSVAACDEGEYLDGNAVLDQEKVDCSSRNCRKRKRDCVKKASNCRTDQDSLLENPKEKSPKTSKGNGQEASKVRTLNTKKKVNVKKSKSSSCGKKIPKLTTTDSEKKNEDKDSNVNGSDGAEDQAGLEKEDEESMEQRRLREMTSQDKIVIADALLSLSESKPSPTEITADLISSQDEIAEFVWFESAKFFKETFDDFIREKEKIGRIWTRDRLHVFRKDKEREFARKTEEILEGEKKDVDIRLSCEMEVINQYFRQELWIRIQKCACGKVGLLSCCSRCHAKFYCSKRCQVADFEDHEVICYEGRK